MKIGIRAHDLGKLSPEEMVEQLKKRGIPAIQLAPHRALDGIETLEQGLDSEQLSRFVELLQAADIEITVMGNYLNYADPIDVHRNANIEVFSSYLREGERLHIQRVGTETGSLDAQYLPSELNHTEAGYQRFLEALKIFVKQAEISQTRIGIEAVVSHIIYDVEVMARLVEDVNSQWVDIIFDPVNLLNPENEHNQEQIVEAFVKRLHNQIAVVHLKDYLFINNERHIVPVGTGRMNFRHLFETFQKYNIQPTGLLEEGHINDIEAGLDYLNKLAAETMK